MGGDQEAARQTIQHYRRLREWVTDPQARRALRELIRSAEADLAEEEADLAEEKEPLGEERDS
jgi:hypothetical protein